MRLFSKFILSIAFSACSLSSNSETIVQIDALDFGDLLPVYGGCNMDWDTGNIVAIGAGSLCNSSPVGTPGLYRLSVDPNLNYEIRVDRREEVNNDGITYQPVGKLTSDTEQLDVVYNQFVTIDSGSSGDIEIQIGGTLFVSGELNGSQTYELVDAVQIYFRQVP